jgi:hypothetical protein
VRFVADGMDYGTGGNYRVRILDATCRLSFGHIYNYHYPVFAQKDSMKEKRLITVIVIAIAALSSLAAAIGIFSNAGPGPSTFISVRGQEVQLYGVGIYHHMSAEVAPQGIAHDVVTLFLGVPLLITSLVFYRRGTLKGQILLSGILGYFLTTYMFFTLMAMYNQLFLLWVIILSLCFHGFYIMFSGIKEEKFSAYVISDLPFRWLGVFLIFCAVSIGLLWLSIVAPSVINGTIPTQVEHYTTLVVQALDLAIGLPVAFIAGIYVLKRKSFGFKLGSIYIVFLSLLMTALSAKIIAMSYSGFNVVPVIFVIPTFTIISILLTMATFKKIHEPEGP